MKDLEVRQGGRLPLQVKQGDETSVSVTIFLRNQDTAAIIQKTADFVDGVANLLLDGDDTRVVGVYDYQVNENFATGDPLKYPDPNDCEDEECTFPTITVCEALDEPQEES